MKKITFLALMLIAMIATKAEAQVSVTLNVEKAGTLSTLIVPEKKYTITQLILTGELNSDDLKYIREMAGRTQTNATTNGSLTTLNVSDAKTIQGGDYYYRVYVDGYYHYYYSSTINGDYYVTTDNVDNYPRPGINPPYYIHYRNDLAKLPLGSRITQLYLPNTATELTEEAYADCSQLTRVIIGISAAMIRKNAFLRCTGLTSLTIPDQATTIADEAFSGCSSIASLKIGNSINTIGAAAFYNCSKIPSVVIPANTTDIAADAFSGCSSMTDLTLVDNLVTLGDNAFRDCSKLKAAVMPLSLVQTGEGIFHNCSSLAEVTIGANLMALKPYSFNGCSALNAIHCHVVKPLSIVENVFNGVNYITCQLFVPKGTYNAYWVAPVWGKFTWINEEYYEDPNADRIFIKNFEIVPGAEKKVEVELQNQSHTCVGFQCDVQLPTGLEFVYNENNYDYVTKAQRTAQYVVGSTMQSNGILRVTGVSPNYRPLSGTDGVIFTFIVRAAADFSEGNINISNAKLSIGSGDESDTYQAPASLCVVTAGNPRPSGDLNGDGSINAGDVSALYKAMLSGLTDSLYDLNGDGSVNAGDVGALYKIILGQ